MGNALVLGQLVVEEKINEIIATPKLVEMLDLKKGKLYKRLIEIFIFKLVKKLKGNLDARYDSRCRHGKTSEMVDEK